MAGGKGIGGALGIAGFTNGECFRIGDPTPELYVARCFFRQNIALNTNKYYIAEDDANQLRGEKVAASRITITAGKFSIADMFDCNTYSHDPRTQFMNWALMSNGAWDYPANTRGYTYGAVVELIKPTWAVRVSEAMVPVRANASTMDEDVSKARAETIELEKDWSIKKKKGAIRVLAFRNLSRAGNYQDAITKFRNGTDTSLNVNTDTVYGGQKYGFGINMEQEIFDDLGFFARYSWNDGKTASWAFTEIDESFSFGLSLRGKKWLRLDDEVGIACVINNISNDHWQFLNAGGYGFIIGDGRLTHYGSETIGEIYYNLHVSKYFYLTADYQYVQNPAYNRDRGPVNVWAIRGHVEF